MKLLIGYDGSDCAKAALLDLQRAGLPAQADATILTISEAWLPLGAKVDYQDLETAYDKHIAHVADHMRTRCESALNQTQQLAESGATLLKQYFPEWQIKAEAHIGSPSWELIRTADEIKPDLLVVGSHGMSALERVWFGSISQKVVAEANCSVRVARGKDKTGPVKIVIGFDGSKAAAETVKVVAERSWPEGSEARLVTSIHHQWLADTNDESDLTMSSHEYACCVNKELEPELLRSGLTVSSAILEAAPARAIVEESEQWQADVIFVGSQGLSMLRRFLLGSVATAVVARAHCSVEVIRTNTK